LRKQAFVSSFVLVSSSPESNRIDAAIVRKGHHGATLGHAAAMIPEAY
jgi:hypothetical protein